MKSKSCLRLDKKLEEKERTFMNNLDSLKLYKERVADKIGNITKIYVKAIFCTAVLSFLFMKKQEGL